MYIEQLYTNCLAEAAYYIESDGEAAIIDPIRETESYIELAKKRNTIIKYIFETHFHADFISGHIDLAHKTRAAIIFGPQAHPSYEVYNAKDQEYFQVGKIKIQVLHTPGHTPESTCYLLFNEEGKPHAIFTGDTLFVGDVGRPDLLDGLISKEQLAGMLFDSLQTKIKILPDNVIVYPAHGAGSACGKNIGKETFSTIGIQKKVNYALQFTSKEAFIEELTKDIPPPPAYFFHDAEINKKGYELLEDSLRRSYQPLSVVDFEKEIHQGALILDTRIADDFEKKFIPNSINIGLDGQYASWVGTLIPIDQPLIIVSEVGKEEESIVRLARVGYENVKGFLQGGISTWVEAKKSTQQIQTIQASEIQNLMNQGVAILDVRKPGEYNTAHIKNTLFISLASLINSISNLSKEKSYMIYCGGGYRSMIAASILKSQGFENIMNVAGGFAEIKKTNLVLETEEKESIVK